MRARASSCSASAMAMSSALAPERVSFKAARALPYFSRAAR